MTSTDAEETCKSICNIFKETSAKSGDDVSNVFTELAEAIVEMNSREMNGGGSGGSAAPLLVQYLAMPPILMKNATLTYLPRPTLH